MNIIKQLMVNLISLSIIGFFLYYREKYLNDEFNRYVTKIIELYNSSSLFTFIISNAHVKTISYPS